MFQKEQNICVLYVCIISLSMFCHSEREHLHFHYNQQFVPILGGVYLRSDLFSHYFQLSTYVDVNDTNRAFCCCCICWFVKTVFQTNILLCCKAFKIQRKLLCLSDTSLFLLCLACSNCSLLCVCVCVCVCVYLYV